MQVVWTGGDRSLALWCAYTGAFLGTIPKDKEAGLPESQSFAREGGVYAIPKAAVEEQQKHVIDTERVSNFHGH